MNSVSFRAFETTGSVGKAEPATAAKNETTGSVGYRANAVPLHGTVSASSGDSVNFKGEEKQDSGISPLGAVLITAGAAALIIGGLGLANKYGGKIIEKCGLQNDGKLAKFLTKNVGEGVTGHCREWCFKVKELCKKIPNLFKKTK